MTMTEYFPIQPLGDRSQEIEAFGSLFSRMAMAHRVTIHVFITHIHHWWSSKYPEAPSFRSGLLATRSPMLCGIGSNVDALVRAIGVGTGDDNLSRTTFLPIRTAISWQGRGLSRFGRAWCPACMEEALGAGEQFYDRLVWSTVLITRCAGHKLLLETNCPRCSVTQERYHKSGRLDICWKCGSCLLSNPEKWRLAVRPQTFEAECMSVVRGIANGSLQAIRPDPYSTFLSELAERFSWESKSIWRTRRFPDRSAQTGLVLSPMLSTFLKSCCVYGVDPVDVLTDPVGAAKSASLLELARISLPPVPRPIHPRNYLVIARKAFEREFAKADGADMLPLRSIAKEVGVSPGYLNYHFGDLVAEYSSRRTTALDRRNELRFKSALALLKAELLPLYRSPTIRSIDDLASTLAKRAGVSINCSRRAIKMTLGECKPPPQNFVC